MISTVLAVFILSASGEIKDQILVHTDDPVIRAGHARVGLIRRPIRKNACVRRRYMCVSANHGRHTTIQMPSHGDLFAGCFRMEVDETDAGVRDLRQQLIRFAEGTIQRGHVRSTLEIDDGALYAIASSDNDQSLAR